MNQNEFPEFHEDDFKADELFFLADTWLEQVEFIGSLMMVTDYPEHWEDFVTEPSPEEMELSDACAVELLLEIDNAKID